MAERVTSSELRVKGSELRVASSEVARPALNLARRVQQIVESQPERHAKITVEIVVINGNWGLLVDGKIEFLGS